MGNPQPVRPDSLETVLFEPDEQRALAVLPGGLWPSPGDIVELDDPPRHGRVLSTRLQVREGKAQVLVIVDVPEAALASEAIAGEAIAGEAVIDEAAAPSPVLSAEIDRELAALEPDSGASPA